MSEPVFLLAGAIACGTILVMVKIIATAFTGGRTSKAEIAELRDQVEQSTAMLDETQATVANQSAQIAELQERLDFAERLLTQGANRPGLRHGDAEGGR